MKRRRSSQHNGHDEQRGRGTMQWGVFAMAACVAITWVIVTLTLLPRSLHSVSEELDREDVDDMTAFRQHNVEQEETVTPATAIKDNGKLSPDAKINANKRRFRQGEWKPLTSQPPPLTMDMIIQNMTSFLDDLHTAYAAMKPGPEPLTVWETYKEIADRWLLPIDRKYTGWGTFPLRDDDSIFVSVASYRDENCGTTLKELYTKADNPNKLFVGLVQQNCVQGCRSGVLDKWGKVEDVEPDPDCFKEFCSADGGAYTKYCDSGHIRNFFVNESESLGPAVARYFASKLWEGETYFMQIDSHMLFEHGWDTAYIEDMKRTESYPKTVLSHYPPDTKTKYQGKPGYRICEAGFTTGEIERKIIRLGSSLSYDKTIPEKPCYAPYVGAGFFFAHSSFLTIMPYDPYVPWVFMGEEILLSLRFWTWGYDIFAPTRNMISHFYLRRHKPKFWETVGRLFKKPGIHNGIQRIVIDRVKNVVGYPEAGKDVIYPPSLLAHLDLYGEGAARPLAEYMANVGLDCFAKKSYSAGWCKKCTSPERVLPHKVFLSD